jgi:hypothetical protein
MKDDVIMGLRGLIRMLKLKLSNAELLELKLLKEKLSMRRY